jgi:enolase-phosphatase E1
MDDLDFASIRAIVTDIEGTTTPIAFVRDVLFPYARRHLHAFREALGHTDAVRVVLDDVCRLAPAVAPETTLLQWMADDAKVTPLKTLQGLIWEAGYRTGAIRGPVYPDVPPALRAWHAAGKRLSVYSSGSVAAQKLIFGYSDAGDLQHLFDGYFDTTVGGKRDVASYARIADEICLPPAEILFLSDVAEELDAAHAAGWRGVQLLRVEDGTIAAPNHATAPSFDRIFQG